jgi:hypothetical protein
MRAASEHRVAVRLVCKLVYPAPAIVPEAVSAAASLRNALAPAEVDEPMHGDARGIATHGKPPRRD